MNDLKKFAGLLNDEAPENHFLAYITPSERDMLVDAGGVKTPTPSGIFAYPPQDNYTSSYDSSQNTSGRTSSTSGAGGGSGYSGGGNDNDYGDGGWENTQTKEEFNKTPVNTNYGNDNDDIDSTYTPISFDVTPEPVEKNFFEKVIDFVAGGGVVGNVIQAIGGKLNPKNQYEGITGEDGYGEGDYISNQGDWAASKGYVDESADYYALDLEEQQAIDKMMFDDGVRSQAFSNLYNDGDTSQNNLNNLTSTERNEINKIIPNLPDAIGGTTQQESMVNKYFANTSNNLGISQDFMTSYDQAKADLAKTLNMTSNASQFGYNANMSASNIYYNYLKEQGLL